MTLFSSEKPIFRQPRSFKSLDILLFVRIGHSPDRALFPPVLITPVVMSSLLSTLTWPSLLFLSPIFLPRTPTQTISVLKFFFPTTHPYNSLTSTPLQSEALLLILTLGPSLLTSFQTPLTPLYLETLTLTIQPGTLSSPLTRPEMTCFAGSLPPVRKSWTTPPPTLLHHSIGSRSSPDISLAPHCEWRTLPGLGSDHLPIEIVLPLSPVRHPSTSPAKFNYKKASWDVYQSYIVEHLPSFDVDAVNIHQAARSFSLFLVEAAKASIPFDRLGRSPKAWWSQEAESAVRKRRRARSEAHQS